MHSRCQVLHRDIKPGNAVVGVGLATSTVHLIDFGISKRFIDPKTGVHIKLQHIGNLTGTCPYASNNALNKMELSRRDDLESLVYMLIKLATGTL